MVDPGVSYRSALTLDAMFRSVTVSLDAHVAGQSGKG